MYWRTDEAIFSMLSKFFNKGMYMLVTELQKLPLRLNNEYS